MHLSGLAAILPAIGLSVAAAELPSNCRVYSWRLSATAQNRVMNVRPDFSSIEGAIDFLTQPVELTTVSGTETIRGTYCSPTKDVASRSGTLQILLHGNTYDSSYWHGLGDNSLSWVAYFNKQGYPVLNIDRVGSGASSHPDPETHVQTPYQVELLNELIKDVKNTGPRIGMRPPPASKVIVVGHSYGSILSNQLAVKYPRAADSYVLTGLAIPQGDQNPLPGQIAMGLIPAAVHDPARFGNLPAGYLTTSSSKGRNDCFYGDAAEYLPSVYDTDFKTEGTLSTGEALTQTLGPAQQYSGPVFVLTGREDAVFCGYGARSIAVPDCGDGAQSNLAAMKVLYPAVADADFGFYTQEHAGHCNGLHYSAQSGFRKAAAFLQAHGF